MSRSTDDPFEQEEERRQHEAERAERRREKAPVYYLGGYPELNRPVEPTPEQAMTARLEMACLQCGAGMIRGTQCRRCGAWCR